MSFSSIKVNTLQRFSLNFSANLIAAFWMLLGSVRAFLWVKPSLGQFVCFLLVALSANVLFAWLAAELESAFNVQGLISYLVWPTIMLLAGIILAKRSQNYSLVFVPAVLWLTADGILALVQSLIQFLILQNLLPEWAYTVAPVLFLVLFVWQTAALLLIFAKKLRWAWHERVLMSLGVVALLGVWQKNVNSQPIFKRQVHTPTILEADFYAQPVLLANELKAISKGNMGVSEWYFMGVAGFGGQDVFAHEIEQARQLFDVRFRTLGRSAVLINNRHTWQQYPIATQSSIALTLKKIGEQMNRDEDVLFLTLTSHGIVYEDGTPTGAIELDNPPLTLEAIDGKWLKEALDLAGIRWRVIVVSACYSGTMIEALSSPTTVIITASASDKASFGCTNEAHLTYFGQAFFVESMREGKSFVDVFNRAKRHVSEREALLGFEPSEPQMFVGALMKTALPEFEKDLFGHAKAP